MTSAEPALATRDAEHPWCSEARLAEVNAAATRKRKYIDQLWARITERDRQIKAQAREIQRLRATLKELRSSMRNVIR